MKCPLNLIRAFMAWQIVFVAAPGFAQAPVFQKVLDVGLKDPTVLDVVLAKGDVFISYNRDDQVVIYAIPKDDAAKSAAKEFFESGLRVEEKEGRITIRISSSLPPPSFLYRIGVPFRTEVTSSVTTGNQKVLGIAGPANISSGAGDIDVSYVRFAPVRARTGQGRITCKRVIEVDAETRSGNIVLMEDGASRAAIQQGFGTIDIGGARGSVDASTDGGDLHIKAVPAGDWRLNSVSGNIRIELPPASRFDFDAGTVSGRLAVGREDMRQPADGARDFQQKVSGGGKQIQARSHNGNITIQ